MVDTYSKEVVKEFVLQRLRLTPDTLGTRKGDVPPVVRAIGGLQYGGHKIELFNRFENLKPEWFDYWYENHVLVDGHVLRGALRIVNVDEYPYYFKATRGVARRRAYHKCPTSLSDDHHIAFNFIDEYGPFTPSEFKRLFGAKHTQLKGAAKKLLYDLYNYGIVARMGRRNQKPLYHATGKLPYKLELSQVGEKEAKEWLFLKCLSIYGPFTLKDIAHWVGWKTIETREILDALLEEDKVIRANIEGDRDAHYVKVEDATFLNALRNDLPEQSFVRILFNDDAFLLGYYRRLKDYFGYRWKYPQLSEGIVWRAAILKGRDLIGEAVVEMYAKSRFLKVKRILLRTKFVNNEVLAEVQDGFMRHAKFQNRTLEMASPNLI